MEELKKKAQAKGLWNLWISKDLAVSIQHLRPRDAQVHITLAEFGPITSKARSAGMN